MTGLDRLAATGFARFQGQRVGLVTHPAALTTAAPFRSAHQLFRAHTTLVTLFGPEHGFTGEAQDLIAVDSPGTGPVRVVSLYGSTFESLKPTPEQLAGLDVLVIDLQDVGSRYYTFQATMLYCLEACAAVGVPVAVLDRPNPIGRTVEGPAVAAGFTSFVGPHDIATRHGLTIGELARLYAAERGIGCDLTVVPCEVAAATEFRVPPSPNMPTLSTAVVYPGMCLVEGTNLSEGRGTTRPFELVGHPDLDPERFADELNGSGLTGVEFHPVRFTPTFQKHAGASCGGVMTLPTGDDFRPVRTGLAVLCAARKLLGTRLRWRTETYEFVSDRPAIDLLFGSDRERHLIDQGVPWRAIADHWAPEEALFLDRRQPHLTPEAPDRANTL